MFAPVLREYLCRYPKGPIGSADRVPAKDRRRGMKQPKVDQHGVYIQKIGNGEWKYELKAILPFFVRFLSISDPLKVADPLS